jgi:hypothetical protein
MFIIPPELYMGLGWDVVVWLREPHLATPWMKLQA